MIDILKFIKTIRESSPLIPTIYTNGSCYRFHLILKQVFPSSIPYYNSEDHVVSKIGDKFYDILGRYKKKDLRKMTKEDIKDQKKYVCCTMFFAREVY